MEWHKASLRAGPDGFDHDHRARKLVLSSRRRTRSPPLFQCVAWQSAFHWWGPNKAWRRVTLVHACWQPPTPPPPHNLPPPPPCLRHQAAPSSRRPIHLSTLEQTLTLIMEGHCSCQMGLMTQSIRSNTGDGSGMLGMGLGFGRREWSVCLGRGVCGILSFFSKETM